jgi:hypothetical protein
MKKKLGHIRKKIDDIQIGLLRFRDDQDQVTLHVKAKSNEDDSVNCIIAGNADLSKLANRSVNLVQKYENDFLYISGQVKEKAGKNQKMLSFKIIRACWFIRKSKGTLSWLQEKYIYDIFPDDELELAS